MRCLTLKLLAGLLLSTDTVMAQAKLSVEPRIGYGSFKMSAMKDYQQVLIRHSEVKAKATDSFGPHYQFGANLKYALGERSTVGLFLERGTTGGRVHYEDYSGELQYDMLLQHMAVGIILSQTAPVSSSAFRFEYGAEVSLFYSRLTVEESGHVYDRSFSAEQAYRSNGYGIKPFVGLQYPILSFPTSVTIGYLANGNGAYYVAGSKGSYPVALKSKDLKPDWSGFRLNLSVAIPIIRQKR